MLDPRPTPRALLGALLLRGAFLRLFNDRRDTFRLQVLQMLGAHAFPFGTAGDPFLLPAAGALENRALGRLVVRAEGLYPLLRDLLLREPPLHIATYLFYHDPLSLFCVPDQHHAEGTKKPYY